MRFSRLLTARHRREFDVIFKEHAKPRSCSQIIEEETVEEERFCRRHTNGIETDCRQSTWITPRACCGDCKSTTNEQVSVHYRRTAANKYMEIATQHARKASKGTAYNKKWGDCHIRMNRQANVHCLKPARQPRTLACLSTYCLCKRIYTSSRRRVDCTIRT